MKPVFPFLLISFLAVQHAIAQQQPRWGLGVGAAVSDSVYAGEGTRVRAVPLLTHEGERFFWRGIGGGAHLVRQGGLALDATLSARLDGIDRKDFGTAELARRGVDRALLDDRDDGLDLGLAASWRGTFGQVELAVKGDITGASKGYEAGVRYAYPLQFGGTRITPNASVSHLSKKLANYYYGTLASEAARGVADYRPGGATVPRIGVDVFHPLGERWAVIGNVSYRRLPDRLKDSPLVEEGKDGAASAFIGVARNF